MEKQMTPAQRYAAVKDAMACPTCGADLRLVTAANLPPSTDPEALAAEQAGLAPEKLVCDEKDCGYEIMSFFAEGA